MELIYNQKKYSVFFYIKKITHISASFGGIFGLCLGGSVISMIELLFYFTVRLFSSYAGNDVEDLAKEQPTEWNAKKPSLLMSRDRPNRVGFPRIMTVKNYHGDGPPVYGRYME